MRISQSDYLAMEARLSKRTPTPVPARVQRESDLQDDIEADCRRRGWIALRSRMDRATTRKTGEPDFCIVADGRVIWVECKSGTGKPTAEQLGMHAWFRKLGHVVHVVRSMEEFLEAIKND